MIIVNDEGKVRRSTKSEILGKAKVISYEDLEKARVNRITKEVAKEAKKADIMGKRGNKRKRENFARTDIFEKEAEAEAVYIRETQVKEDVMLLILCRAPVTRI